MVGIKRSWKSRDSVDVTVPKVVEESSSHVEIISNT